MMRDWIHGVVSLADAKTYCGRSTLTEGIALREPSAVAEVDCPTCYPLAHVKARDLAHLARLAPEVKAMMEANDIGPFLPLLRRELLAIGFGEVDETVDVVSRRGYHVVALRIDSVRPYTFWIRYRQHEANHRFLFYHAELLVELAWSQPLEGPADIALTADAGFIAKALWGMAQGGWCDE
jgi:hypothetical protein